ncbi:MAG: hypothetical protein ACOYB2_11020 [Limnohabitans sp.]
MRKLFALVSAFALVLGLAGTALAWQKPSVEAQCAPDAEHYAWTVTLTGAESNYDFDWSFGKNGPWTKVDGSSGANDLTTPRGGDTLYVRWTSDHSSVGKAEASDELCEQPTPEPTPTPTIEPTPTPTVEPTPTPTIEPTPTPTVAPTPTPTIEPTPTPTATPCEDTEAGCPTPTPEPTPTPTAKPTESPAAATLPPTDTLPTSGGGNGGSPLWPLVALAGAIGLAVTLVRPVRSSK